MYTWKITPIAAPLALAALLLPVGPASAEDDLETLLAPPEECAQPLLETARALDEELEPARNRFSPVDVAAAPPGPPSIPGDPLRPPGLLSPCDSPGSGCTGTPRPDTRIPTVIIRPPTPPVAPPDRPPLLQP